MRGKAKDPNKDYFGRDASDLSNKANQRTVIDNHVTIEAMGSQLKFN